MHGGVRAAALAVILLGTAVPFVFSRTADAAGSVEVYLGGLNIPIALSFSPDGRIFYAERNTGAIRIIVNRAVLPTPFYTLTNTNSVGERGLLGLALDPGFPSSPYVYAYQSYSDATNGTVYNRVLRIVANGDVGTSHSVILQMQPLAATNHNGGVIAFGPDGKLYVVVGENAIISLSQNRMSPLGKVLRLNPDGSPPSDNPFFGSLTDDNRIFTYGHRNMFGLAFHPFTGRVYVTENGPGCNDEINLLTAGANFGWGTSQTCSSPPPPPTNTNRDGPNPVLPIFWWGSTICPTNAAIYGGPNFTAWRGDLFMGDCNNRRLHRLDLAAPNYDTVLSDTILWTAPSFIMDVESGPDGAIWFTTPSTIYRYYDTAQPPVAQFVAAPQRTIPGNPITFDGTPSRDPDGTIVSWSWDFGDGQTGSGTVTNHAYGAPGTYTVALTVVDNETYSDVATQDVVIDRLPLASFAMSPSPADPAEIVTFDASASQGNLSAYDWTFGDGGTAAGVVVTHAYASPGSYDITLTVTDNSSLNDSETQVLRVNAPPTASFVADPPQTVLASPVTFNASTSSDPDGTIAAFAWDFGDGVVAGGMVVTHEYATRQPFTVTLTVTDNDGTSDTTTRTVLVANRGPLITAPTPSAGTARITEGDLISFTVTAQDPDLDPLTYSWRVDGVVTGADAATLLLSGSAVGTYTVNVTVSDGELQDWREWTLVVGPPPAANATLPWIAGLALLAVVLAVLLILLRKRGKKEDEQPRP